MWNLIGISVGACAGAIARWQLGRWLNQPHSFLPWGTLAANLVGGYVIGLLVALFQHSPGIDPVWRLVWITGFLGALTTFSSFSAETVAMLQAGRFGLALLQCSLHLLGSLALTALGLATGNALWAAR
ncbi:fluoride efflux transporter CrcB [Comamonas sp. J-3]|uniref:fluoride efflux transporter CrcB n=1 Tax=Comamonas trifloxystrobinivorans TaxID=3350256 RepID=UPI003726C614